MNPGNSTDEERERPRTYKRVLVMCQRKASDLPKDVNSVAKAVSDIDTYIASITPTREDVNVSIEYLTYHYRETHRDYADHIFELSQRNVYGLNPDKSIIKKKTQIENFMTHHIEYYDIIILNTCPIAWLDFGMIYIILKPNGILIVKGFGSNKESSPKQSLFFPQERLDEITRTITSNSFIKQEGSFFGYLTFKKASVPSVGMGKKLKKVYTRLKSRRRLKETRRKKRKRRAIK